MVDDSVSSCASCGDRFTRRRRDQRFCCGRCRDQWQIKHNADKRRENLRRWQRAHRKTTGTIDCAVCGATVEKRTYQQRYCSPECKREAQRPRDRARNARRTAAVLCVTKRCGHCGTDFTPRHRTNEEYCSRECRSIARYQRISERWRANGYPAWCRSGYIKRAKRFGVAWEPINPIAVFERDGWRCQICGRKTPKRWRGTSRREAPELDHRIPLSRGGSHTWENVQCACRKCNRTKWAHEARGQLPLFARPDP